MKKMRNRIFVLTLLLAVAALLGVRLAPPSSHAQVTSVGTSPTFLARFDATAQAANIASTVVITTSSPGTYRVVCYVEVTQTATTSSTMPACVVGWTTADSVTAQTSTISPTSAANTLGANSVQGSSTPVSVIQVAKFTNINVSTASYASVGGTPMQYAIHFKIEFIGS
jgi:hypothetical protein